MPAGDYASLKKKQTELIRKSLQGSVFIASIDAAVPTFLTDPTSHLLNTLPVGTPTPFQIPWEDLGFLSTDGAQFSNDVSSSDVTSWGSVSPTRSDITADTSSMTCLAQETKLNTIALYTGAVLSKTSPAAGGELVITKPPRPKKRAYRVLSLAVDDGDAGEIYVGRLLARAVVVGKAEQAFGAGDDPIGWGVTFNGEEDSTLGFAERWFFGGPGWNALLVKMGFTAAA